MRGDEHVAFVRLIKLNVGTKEFVTWEESGGFTSEPVFVKAPDGKAEDRRGRAVMRNQSQ